MSALRRVLACVVLASTFLLAPAPAQAAAFSVLVFSKTAGFRHDSIPAGIAAIQALGTANDFTVVATEDAAQFNDANLANYATVVWLSTTGDVLDANQQAAFERYIRAGGGYVGVHAAADTEFGWAWYGNLAGAYFSSHPAVQSATVKVEDPAHPSTTALPGKWTRTDEWYNFQSNPRPRVHVLASLDEKTYSPGTPMGSDHPITWCQDFEGGKSWYTGLGHDSATFNDPAFRGHLLGGIQTTADAVASDCKASLPGNFQKVTLDSNTQNPMELDVAADGRVFYIERDGRVQIIQTSGSTVTAATLPVFTGNEDGLLGVRLDPNFASNGFIYLYYSPATGGPRNQISRFTVSGNSISLPSEVVMLQVTTQRNTCCHAGGSMTFDAAGNLYLATGDNTNPFESDGYSPLDERAGRQDFDAQRTSGNTNDLRGKIIRITPQANGTYTIPAGNLFAQGTANTRAEIFAMGFRNPFRIGVDKATNTLYAADYGPDAGAAVANRGPAGNVEWNIVTAGNYGWPYCHGNNYAYHDWTFPSGPSNGAYNCAAGPANNSPNNTGLTTLPPAKPATVDYGFGGNPLFPEIGGGGAPMGGPVYRYNAALNSARKWPAYWSGKALFGEWNQNKMYTMQVTPDGKSLVDINQLFTGMNVLRPMDLEFGPDGAMYLIEWGTGFGGNNADSGIYRIDYLVGDAAPIAMASATPTSGPTPLTVQFSSAGSNDPGGQVITYSWAFGDGTSSTAANPSKTYSVGGSFTAVLTVRDPGGKTGTASVPISVGNTLPQVNMAYPLDGGFFAWGDQIHYTTTVTDPDETIACNRLVLQYYLGHDEHGHPIQNYTGCTGTVATASNSGHGDDSNVFSVFEAAYTDNGGLVGRSTKVLQPKHKQAEHFSSTGRAPGGIGTGDPGVIRETTGDTAGGFQNIGFVEDGDYWAYTPVNLSNIDSIRFRAASPGGGRIEVRTGSASGTLLATATVTATAGWQVYGDFTVAIPASTVTGPLFFVVKNPTGGTGTGGILNVNWVDFNGRGMADTAGLVVSPTSLSFGSQNVGTTSNPQNVTITNQGTASVPVPAVSVGSQFTQTNNCPTALGAGATCTVQVRFAPTSAGAKSATLTVGTSSVALSGTGVSSTTNLALGKATSASTSNGGFAASNVNDDNAASYWESQNNAFPQWVQVDLASAQSVGSVTLKLPSGWGSRTQTLSVQGSTDGSNWPVLSASAGRVFDPAAANAVNISFTAATVRYVRVYVTANTGWPAAQLSELQIFSGGGPGTPVFGVSPSSLNFGSVNVGSTSNPQTVVLSNTGTAAGAVSISAPSQFAQTNNCGSSLAAGASCNINVTFSPTSGGAKSGNLSAAGLNVTLSGTGVGGVSNLALNKPVIASHVQNYTGSNAVDSDVNSYWESPNNAFPQSITVDLGATCALTSIVLRVPPAWGSRNQTLSILGSTNGSTYTTIVGSASYAFPAGGTVTVNLPAGTTARHVRLTITANTGWPAGQLSDLQIMGTVQ